MKRTYIHVFLVSFSIVSYIPLSVANDDFRIVNPHTNKALTLPDCDAHENCKDNSVNVFIYDIYDASGSGYNQKWRLMKDGKNYRILNPFSGKYLTLPDCAAHENCKDNGINVFIYEKYNANGNGYNQQWNLVSDGSYYRIMNPYSQKYLTLPDCAAHKNCKDNGVEVFIYEKYDANGNGNGNGYNQKWKFVEDKNTDLKTPSNQPYNNARETPASNTNKKCTGNYLQCSNITFESQCIKQDICQWLEINGQRGCYANIGVSNDLYTCSRFNNSATCNTQLYCSWR